MLKKNAPKKRIRINANLIFSGFFFFKIRKKIPYKSGVFSAESKKKRQFLKTQIYLENFPKKRLKENAQKSQKNASFTTIVSGYNFLFISV